MKTFVLAFGVGAVALLAAPTAEACGFKAGGAVGAVRFDQLNRTSNPVNIVMYANQDSDDAEKTLSPKLEVVLAKIGHAVHRVEKKDEFDRVLRDGKFPCEAHGSHDVQVVLADLPDAEKVQTKYAVVPIVSQPETFDKAKRQKYPVVLTPSARPSSHVPSIENVARTVAKKQPTQQMVAVAAHASGDAETRTPENALAQRTPEKTSSGRELVDAKADGATRGEAVGAGQGEGVARPAERAAVSGGTGTVEATPVAARTEAPPARPEPARAEVTPVAAPRTEPARAEPAAKAEPIAKVEPKPAARTIEPIEDEPAPKATSKMARAEPETTMAARVAPEEKPKKGVKAPSREEMYFSPGSSKISAKFAKALDRHARWLEENSGASLTLEGHADRSGPADMNQALSERRADAAKAYLVGKGISADRLKTVGLGEESPVDPPGDSSRNRCVVVIHEE